MNLSPTSRRSLLTSVLPLALAALGCSKTQAVGDAGAGSANVPGARRDIILATTTSTQDSGLLDVLVPEFTRTSGYTVKTIAVGSGQALAMGERGEADVLLTHAPEAERELEKKGVVTSRTLVMHNDFVLLGPAGDPAAVKGKPAVDALAAIFDRGALFVSRGDESGTHKLEKKLWKLAARQPAGAWYQESGVGMGQTLTIADQKNAYTLSDRATYLAHRQHLSLAVLVDGGGELMNVYHVMLVNAERFTKVNRAGAQAFADFLLSKPTQSLIASFGQEKYGRALFYADGGKTEDQLQRGE